MMTLGKSRMSTRRFNELFFCFCVLLPILALYAFLRIEPIGRTVYLSFHKWDMVEPIKPFVGLRNFVKLSRSSNFHSALMNTLFFTLFTVPIQILISLLLALGLNSKRIRLVPFYQTVFFLPVVTSMVPVAVIWKWIYDPTYGLLNYFISLFGIKPVAWLIDDRTALLSIAVMSVWKMVGYYMVIFLVGIKAIPQEYYEAASIDGANQWQQFRRVTVPLLKPITLFVFVISTIRSFQVFTQVYVMTVGSQGAPGDVVRVLVYEIYENGFRFFKMGYASAESMILFLIIAVVTVFQFLIARDRKGRRR